jgi:putative thiamine transport system permease protein
MLGLVAVGPMAASALAAVARAFDGLAWQAVWRDPQTPVALSLSLFTGVASTLLTLFLTRLVLAVAFPGRLWQRLVRSLAPMLAMPHVAFAIGLAFLVAPSGWLLRLLSPWATGFEAPPPWVTTQDPLGVGLVAVLVLKETPFLLWAVAAQLQRADLAQRLSQELAVARTLGYTAQRAWARIVWPQLAPRLAAPLAAVLAYNLTVVDVAQVIGPGSPPTFAVLVWTWLNDAEPDVNAQGATGALLLTVLLVVCAAVLWLAWRWAATWWLRGEMNRGRRGWQPRGPAHLRRRIGLWLRGMPRSVLTWAIPVLGGVYVAVVLVLAVSSVAGVWQFPSLWPQVLSWQAWQAVGGSLPTLINTLGLALGSAAMALVWAVAWLELAPPSWEAQVRRWLYVPLVLPSVLWVIGLHRLALAVNLDGQWLGVLWAHGLITIPYALIALAPAYSSFDDRLRVVAATLGISGWRFLWRVKWPLLKASLAAAFAVGFAVSVAQYLSTLYVGAGRFNTVSTEAVALASGGQRSLTAAYAALQALAPLLMFGWAAWVGQPRRFAKPVKGAAAR